MSYLKSRFPALHEKIAARCENDPALAEICGDLEDLATLFSRAEVDLDAQAKQDLLDSIRGLENEISAVFELNEQ